jgi:hypothetical protein
MACEVKKLGDTTAIICSRGRRPLRCLHCGRPADLLCDYPVPLSATRKTCDASLCGACTTKKGGADFCRPHAALWAERAGKVEGRP